MKSKVLDKGFIEVVDSLGNDLTVVNSARVSFGKRKEKWDNGDEKLVRYLAKYKHYSPFRHLQVQFHVKAPEFVMRQWYKHVVGAETTSNSSTKDHAWNEISGRYMPVKEFYYPKVWRKQSEDNKQASEGELTKFQSTQALLNYGTLMKTMTETYEHFIEMGMAKEQARIVLPLSQYTLVYWTASFQSVMNFIELRDEPTSQWEIREYAIALKEIMMETFPETTKLWSENYWDK